MLKACSYCGRIHDSRLICLPKQARLNRYPKDTEAAKTRSSSRWQKTRDYIRQRDHNVCQLCLLNCAGTIRPYEGEGLSVHHIIKLEEDSTKAFDEDNLITLCRVHHEMAEEGKIDRGALLDIAKRNGEIYRGTCRDTAKVSPGL